MVGDGVAARFVSVCFFTRCCFINNSTLSLNNNQFLIVCVRVWESVRAWECEWQCDRVTTTTGLGDSSGNSNVARYEYEYSQMQQCSVWMCECKWHEECTSTVWAVAVLRWQYPAACQPPIREVSRVKLHALMSITCSANAIAVTPIGVVF